MPNRLAPLRQLRLAILAFALLAAAIPVFAQVPTYRDVNAPLESRVDDLMSRLTSNEKLALISGTQFSTNPIPRLGIPAMCFADAGEGVRGGMPNTLGPATLFPAEVAMAAAWDTNLVRQIGKAIGEEALNKGTGTQIELGPAVNIHRSPLCGRNGEYFSEDPYLAARLAVSYIEGMQSTGCGACIKHYCCNNEEVDRGYVNVRVDERALREIYLPAFEASAKEAHVWSVMSSYNMVNGAHSSANRYLLTDVLKNGWGWDGFVMSDWGGVHATAPVINAGNDLEMPGPGDLSADRAAKAIGSGLVTQETTDANVRRILRAMIRCGLANGTPHVPDRTLFDSPEHRKLAYEAGCDGVVLLKNVRGLLPLDVTKIHSIAVIGSSARHLQLGAQGSVGLSPIVSSEPLDAIAARVGTSVRVDYAEGITGTSIVPETALVAPGGSPGLRAEYFDNKNLIGKPVATGISKTIDYNWSGSPAAGIGHENFSVRWTGKLVAPATGTYVIEMAADDGCRVYIGGKEVVSHWVDGAAEPIAGQIDLTAGASYDLRVEYYQHLAAASARLTWSLPGTRRFGDAVDAAGKADVAIVFADTGRVEAEGQDRPSMDLPNDQAELIAAIAAVNKNTIVVLNNGSPVNLEPWLDAVPALVEAWFPGQDGGRVIASMLFGDVNPSGKLPDTFAVRREDYPDYGNFPGTHGIVRYAEGIYVGYRHFDKHAIAPAFPFGYGLSYTTFRYSRPTLSTPTIEPDGRLTASIDITNTGTREGAEVAELYVHEPQPKIDMPLRELKGFAKVDLLPGQTKTVTFALNGRSLAYCDVPGKQWKADAGCYDIELGASSHDIRQTILLTLLADYREPIPFMANKAASMGGTDLALNRPATASSEERDDTPASAAFDGDDGTRWSSLFSDPQWICVNLGAAVQVGRVRLLWEEAYAASYKLQVSQDGVSWHDVYATEKGAGGEEIVCFAPLKARYVRMYGVKRATPFGYSLYSFEVYAR